MCERLYIAAMLVTHLWPHTVVFKFDRKSLSNIVYISPFTRNSVQSLVEIQPLAFCTVDFSSSNFNDSPGPTPRPRLLPACR